MYENAELIRPPTQKYIQMSEEEETEFTVSSFQYFVVNYTPTNILR
jgi:hypothetical protein